MSELILGTEEISKVASDVFLINDWKATKSDVELVNKIAMGFEGGVDLHWILTHCVKIDSLTNRLITSGWNLFNGEFFFSNANDARDTVVHYGYKDLEHAANSYENDEPARAAACYEIWW